MPYVDFVAGSDDFPALEVSDGCTVGGWKEDLAQGCFGEKIPSAFKLSLHKERDGQALPDDALLPTPPHKVYVDGNASVVAALVAALRRRLPLMSSRSSPGGSRRASRYASSRLQPNSARQSAAMGRPTGRQGTEEAAVLDGDAAAAVLRFWFEELTLDDWFRRSATQDEYIRQEFGALHARAAAGELAGWMSRPDTCLALVVLLDQFTRRLHRGTDNEFACDAQARMAANAALARGDDRRHWPPGPRRSALYLPFMHSEDLADKKRCMSLMREGLVLDAPGSRHHQALAALVRGVAQNRALKDSFLEEGLPGPPGAASNAPPRAAAQGPAAVGGGGGGVVGLPRLGATGGCRRSSVHRSGRPTGGAQGPLTGAAGAQQGVGDSLGQGTLAEDAGDDGDFSSSSDGDSDDVLPAERYGGVRAAGAGPSNARQTPRGGVMRGGGGQRWAIRAEAGAGSYSMQAALELPDLPVVMLNHEHAKRFRMMKLDAQTEQAYLRDKNDVNRTMRYQCLVCGVHHEFRLSKGANGAEHQHQHP